ncbi:hypothetical protein F5B22DRAFT_626460 [Xylaria bambusicola]|uniref:uncharacterized protein n=1 Tax=Xylaria bambusicola TaxID=326684 RepID=UPI0020078D78|nr:uncharacterized protein F5B22DRAFT_626460 [Xylaria bambusicola]KAI0505820.1 hypothetical protein F5B22DRAFT_626460 [Xylaria bambusicola]
MLGRLPQNIRVMIYDVSMPAAQNFDFSVAWPPLKTHPNPPSQTRHIKPKFNYQHYNQLGFPIPKMAHVCREMRQYAMPHYRLLWFRYTRTLIAPKQEIDQLAFWNKPPLFSGFGFFNPSKDQIRIYVMYKYTVHLLKSATIQWNDPFQEPTWSFNDSTWVKRYNPSHETLRDPGSPPYDYYTIKENGVWKDCGQRDPPVLV